MTSDEAKVVTCGGDGVVMVWRVAALDDKAPGFLTSRERLQDLPAIHEMLVSRADLKVSGHLAIVNPLNHDRQQMYQLLSKYYAPSSVWCQQLIVIRKSDSYFIIRSYM